MLPRNTLWNHRSPAGGSQTIHTYQSFILIFFQLLVFFASLPLVGLEPVEQTAKLFYWTSTLCQGDYLCRLDKSVCLLCVTAWLTVLQKLLNSLDLDKTLQSQGWKILKTVTRPTSPNVSNAMENLIINIGKIQNFYSSCNIWHS